jgi:hypothetical protein
MPYANAKLLIPPFALLMNRCTELRGLAQQEEVRDETNPLLLHPSQLPSHFFFLCFFLLVVFLIGLHVNAVGVAYLHCLFNIQEQSTRLQQ